MRTFISIVLLLACSNIYAANITAKLDVNPVLLNDTFLLTYTASGSVDDEPDFSLIKNDFEILSTQQSSNMSMINGNITRSKTWTLTLIAKAKGIFTIPAISFGSDKAPKVNVVVKSVPVSNAATPNQNFILELESSQQNGFIQQQFIITVRLLIAKDINNYQFSELSTSNPDTLILPLGKDQQYKTYRGAKQYISVEKKFALFPQKAETLKINPFIAAIAVTNQSSGRFYDPFNTRTTTKRLRSKEINLNVKDIPAQYTSNNWLPSSSIKLVEDWPDNSKLIAGDPITRTITLMADGLSSAQLPDIAHQPIDGIKQYPDKPTLQENKQITGVTSSRIQKRALIPTHAGTYTLPAVTIPWWNTKTNKIVNAYIAKRTFTVLPASQKSISPATNVPQLVTPLVGNKTEPSNPVTDEQQADNNSLWFWLSMLLLVLWLMTLALWFRAKSKITKIKNKSNNLSETLSSNLKRLKSACENNNANETKAALLSWAKDTFTASPVNNLSDITKQVDEPLKQELLTLNTHLYGNDLSDWTCNNIYTLCKNYHNSHSTNKIKKNSAQLEPFNR